MAAKYIFLFLSAFLLVQCSFGNPVASSYDKKSAELFGFVIRDLAFQAEFVLDGGEKILENVIAEASAKSDKSEEVSQKIEEYSNFIDRIEAIKQNQGKQEEYVESSQKLQLSSELRAAWDDDQVLKDLLKKYGLEELDKETDDNLLIFLYDFMTQAIRFWISLSEEEQKQHSDFNEWFKSYKAENDDQVKVDMFDKFFQVIQ